MLGKALGFPTNSDDTLKIHLIGGACVLLGFLIIPAILLQGYFVRVLRAAAEGSTQPPAFTDLGEMLVDGLKLVVIGIAYFLIPLILYFIAIFLFVGSGILMGTSRGAGVGVGAGMGMIGMLMMLVTLLLFLVAGFLLPAAATNFARTDDIGAAFDFGTVTSGALTGDYVVAWVMAIAVGFVLNLIGSMLAIVLIGFLLIFYSQVAVYYLFGTGFVRGLDENDGVGGPTPSEADPA